MKPRSVERFLREEGICIENELQEIKYPGFQSDRQVFAVDQKFVVKTFAPSSFQAYQIQCQMAEVLSDHDVPTPRIVCNRANGRADSYIVFEFCKGRPFNDIYRSLKLEEYLEYIACLGGLLKQSHNVPLSAICNVPFFEEGQIGFFNVSLHRSTILESNIRFLAEAGLLSSGALAAILAIVDRESEGILTTTQSLVHSDIHNENFFVSFSDDEISGQLIDWESSRIQPFELDFVHPFLNILGEAFPQRRLYLETECRSDNLFLLAFERGYGQSVRWIHVAIHAMVWYLENAVTAHRKQEIGLRDFYLQTGIGGLEFVGAARMDEIMSSG